MKLKADACPDIDGVYSNAGEWFRKGKGGHLERNEELSLTHILSGGYYKEYYQDVRRLGTIVHEASKDPFQTVSLRLADGNLHIEALPADGGTGTFELPTRQQCRNSTLLLKKADTSTVDMGISETQSLALGRARDGSLLVYWSETEVLFILGPNGFFHRTDVIRFSPAAPATVQPAAVKP